MYLAIHNGLDVPGMIDWVGSLGFQCPEWASGLFHDSAAATDAAQVDTPELATGVESLNKETATPANPPASDALMSSETVQNLGEGALAYAAYKVRTLCARDATSWMPNRLVDCAACWSKLSSYAA